MTNLLKPSRDQVKEMFTLLRETADRAENLVQDIIRGCLMVSEPPLTPTPAYTTIVKFRDDVYEAMIDFAQSFLPEEE